MDIRRNPFFLSQILLLSVSSLYAKSVPPPRIAIIGAGVGGTSAAVFLRELFGEGARVDIYEEDRVGGRASEITLNGYRHESGGTIIHPRNQYFVNFTKSLGLDHEPESDEILGVYDGKEIVFSTSSCTAVSLVKLFWRYGFDVYNIGKWVDGLLGKFDRIYEHQRRGLAFTDVEKLLRSMSPTFVQMTKHSIKDWLLKDGFHERFIDELVHGGLRVNYGQGTDIHAFVGGVAMAGVEPGLFSVKNGNRQIPERLLRKSGAALVPAFVVGIEMRDERKYRLRFQRTDGTKPTKDTSDVYDVVILAAPVHQRNNMEFHDFPDPIRVGARYHRTVATFVAGKPNPTFADYAVMISESADDSVRFTSISRNLPVNFSRADAAYENDVYKVFSYEPLSDAELGRLFDERGDGGIVKADWMAYPEYSRQAKLASFVLHDNLYYVNAIESAASAFEMSMIGAKNVAMLAYNRWIGNDDDVDPVFSDDTKDTTNDKSEL
ncbi:prenylcysteine oxidase 1-like [Tubulanus polymorphus]|uniref:prenylcysteine oxidase 1-like n=1 Tax=Tubulanus polymorphus TaxID=672921 RepID=UPI003DA33F34